MRLARTQWQGIACASGGDISNARAPSVDRSNPRPNSTDRGPINEERAGLALLRSDGFRMHRTDCKPIEPTKFERRNDGVRQVFEQPGVELRSPAISAHSGQVTRRPRCRGSSRPFGQARWSGAGHLLTYASAGRAAGTDRKLSSDCCAPRRVPLLLLAYTFKGYASQFRRRQH